MAITVIPALDRTSATFKADVDTFFGSRIPTFVSEISALETNVNAKEASAVAAAVTATAQAELSQQLALAENIVGGYKGIYSGAATYILGNVVLYADQLWIVNVSSITGVTPVEGANWAGLSANRKFSNATFLNGYTEATYSPAVGSAFTVSLTNGSVQRFTTNANTTITLPAPAAGKSIQIQITYGGAHTITWSVTGGSTLRWQDGVTPVATAVNAKTDVVNLTTLADGSSWLGAVFGQGY